MERTNEELLAEFEELAEQHPNFMSVAECREVADKLVLLRQEILRRMSPSADKIVDLLRALKPLAEYGRVLRGQKVDTDSELVRLWNYSITVGALIEVADLYETLGGEYAHAR